MFTGMPPLRANSGPVAVQQIRRVVSLLALVGALVLSLPALHAKPQVAIVVPANMDLGVEYTIGQTKIEAIPGNKFGAKTLTTPVTLVNKENKAKRLVVCLMGVTPDLGGTIKRLQIDLVFENNDLNLTCSIPEAQNLPASGRRLGNMGCRLVSLPANATVSVTFKSGNNRTVPKFDPMTGKPIPGQFQAIGVGGTGGGVGPVQDGQCNNCVLITQQNQVGGHRGGKEVLNNLGDLFVGLILLKDDKVVFNNKQDEFNCNKCFGMDDGSQIGGFFLNLPDDRGRGRLMPKASFGGDWVKYRNLVLKPGGKAQASVNLYNELSYAGGGANGPILAQFHMDVRDLPPACSWTVSEPEDQDFSLSPFEQKTAMLEVTCNASLQPGAFAVFDARVTRTDTDPPEPLTQHVIAAASPPTCDVNADTQVDIDDISEITELRNQPADPGGDPHDIDGDGLITVNDARVCVTMCANPQCAR